MDVKDLQTEVRWDEAVGLTFEGLDFIVHPLSKPIPEIRPSKGDWNVRKISSLRKFSGGSTCEFLEDGII